MNKVFEIAEVAQYGTSSVSVVYSGSEDTIAVSGLGPGILDKAKEQGRKVVELIDTVRVNSSMVITPAEGKVYCYAGMIVEGAEVPEPWQKVETAPIIVEIDKNLAKSQDLISLLRLSEVADALCSMHNEGDPFETHTVHLVDKLKVSTFRQDQWNQLRSTTAYLVRL